MDLWAEPFSAWMKYFMLWRGRTGGLVRLIDGLEYFYFVFGFYGGRVVMRPEIMVGELVGGV
jgi:hypothetical protein